MEEASTVQAASATWLLRVIDFKQYEYCPRVVYYTYCLPGIRPTSYKMDAGIAAQTKVSELEERRSLRAYGVASGVRHFNVPVTSATLKCTGQVDLVIETTDSGVRRLIPVDFKLSRREPGRHFKLQLACYSLMLEENWGIPAPEGFIYLIPSKRTIKISFTSQLRNAAKHLVGQIRAMIEGQQMPSPTRQRSKCVNCEFRRFCNDVV